MVKKKKAYCFFLTTFYFLIFLLIESRVVVSLSSLSLSLFLSQIIVGRM